MYVAQTGTDWCWHHGLETDVNLSQGLDLYRHHRLQTQIDLQITDWIPGFGGKAFGTAATRNGSEIGYETQSRTEREASRSKSRTRLFIGVIRSHTSMVSQERSAHSHLTEFEFAQTTCHSMSSSSQQSASQSAGSEFESSSSRVALSGGTPPPHKQFKLKI